MTPSAATLCRRLSGRMSHTPALLALRAAAGDAQADVWLVGGAVRDAALGRPALDVDALCTSHMAATNRALAARLGVRGFRFRKRGITTWRYVAAGRTIDVVDATRRGLDADLARRDFTINAVAWQLTTRRLHDPLGGRRDLARRLLRLCRPDVVAADPVRALRAARFVAALPGFRLTRPAATASRAAAAALARASVERVRDELDKLLVAASPSAGLDTLARLDLTDAVLPELAPLRGCVAGKDRPDVWTHTVETIAVSAAAGRRRLPGREAIDAEAAPDALRVLRWSLLLHDVAKPATFVRRPGDGKPTFHGHEALGARRADEILLRLRLPKRIRRRVVRLVREHLRPGHLADSGASPRAVRRLVAAAEGDLPLLVLHAACDALGSGTDDPVRWRNLRAVLALLLDAWGREQRTVAPLLSGTDVMRVRSLEPGPAIGRILARARELQVAGRLTTRGEALAWLRGRS